jgi:L-threonylcarbamoyladenylate synthase
MSSPPTGVEAAAQALLGGGLVVFPTDTVFGVACVATAAPARERFYATKGRDHRQPAILMAAELPDLEPWVELGEAALGLAGEHWPGPLTLVLPATARAVEELGQVVAMPASDGSTSGDADDRPTLAVRIPDHPAALALLRAVGQPLATSSANRAGQPPPTTLEQARAALGDGVEVYLPGEVRLGVASSILDLAHGTPRLLREGSIPAERLLR